MSESFLKAICQRFKRGVAKITCSAIEIDVNQPYVTSGSTDDEVCGSAFFVPAQYLYLSKNNGSKRYLVTNAHVIDCCPTKTVALTFPELGKCKMWAKVILACQPLDFAILEVDAIYNEHLEKEVGRTFADIVRSIPPVKPRKKIVDTTKEVSLEATGIGFPLASEDCHISSGKISGRHAHYLQVNASINGGNSGGPLFDNKGNLIGVCAASFDESEGITLAIPWHDIDKMLKHYWDKTSLTLQCPTLGIATKKLIDAHVAVMRWKDNNIKGALVAKVYSVSPLSKLGLKIGHVITSIGDASNEFDIDRNGLINLKHQLDKVPLSSLNVLLLLDPESTFIRTYNGRRRKTMCFNLTIQKGVLRNCMPVLEEIPCAILGGVVFCQFFNNHIEEIEDESLDPGIVQFLSENKGSESAVVITAFRLPSSILQQGYPMRKLSVLRRINKKRIKTIHEFKLTMAKEIKKYTEDNKNRYVAMEIGGSCTETVYVDLDLAFKLEPMLYCTPGYCREHSLITVDMLQNRKRSFDTI
jgi:S1-C subfamily serine protease